MVELLVCLGILVIGGIFKIIGEVLRTIVLGIAKIFYWFSSNSQAKKQDAQLAYRFATTGVTTGHDFEHVCADLLRKNGFTNVRVTRASGDHGADIIAHKGSLSYAIQCKWTNTAHNIGNRAVQEAFAGKGIYGTSAAVVLTNSGFTRQAIEDAKALGVELWGASVLSQLCRVANNGSQNDGGKGWNRWNKFWVFIVSVEIFAMLGGFFYVLFLYFAEK